MTDDAESVRGGGGGGSLGAMSARLTGISAQNEQLRAQVASGRLKIDPEAAEKAAQAYEKAQHRLNRLQRNVIALERVDGLGDYATGIQLATKFRDKALDPEVGASGLLTRLSDELKKKAELFRRAAEEYRNTDESIASDLSRGEQR